MKHPNMVTFMDIPCEIYIEEYCENNQPAITLYTTETEDSEAGEPMAVATVCIPDATFSPNETVIKDYSENKGILAALIRAQVIAPTDKFVRTGHTEYPVVRII